MIESDCFKIAALYKFIQISSTEEIRTFIYAQTNKFEIQGGLIIAEEGLNGTIGGSPSNLDAFIVELKNHVLFRDIEIKYSYSAEKPFFRMRIQIKKEIVTMGTSIASPEIVHGINIEPEQWNELISSPDVLLIDTRNDYEIQLGTFKNAINPNTVKFSEFPEYIKNNVDPSQHKRIAMYCTGGIRCEKASSFMLSNEFNEVYQLKGGILKYLEEIPPENSLFQGECYVFDHRTSVGHGLQEGIATLCRGCRHPLFPEDMVTTVMEYKEGIHCKYCFYSRSEESKQAAQERHKQMQLSLLRNEKHLGYEKKSSSRRKQMNEQR